MKNLFILSILLFLWGCSDFNETVELPTQDVHFSEVKTKLPVININVDQADFDRMYTNIEEEIEIDDFFNLYRNQELVIENEAIELEIKGGYSTRYTLKTLGIKFEDKIDNHNRTLIHPEQVLEHHNIDKIKAIRLRNSGSDFENTMLKDRSITQLAINAGLDLDLTYSEPSLVYINGTFYGLLNIRTEGNTNGMAGLYQVKKNKVTLAKITTRALLKKDGDFDRIDAFVQAIEAKDVAYLKRELDLSNFIDYMVFQSYLGNTDWPHNNARFYAIEDGKFRFVVFDLDKVAWLKMDKSPLTIIENKGTKNILSDLFFALYEDTHFKNAFWDRYHHILDSQTLSYEALKPIVNDNSLQIEQEILLQIEKHQFPRTVIEWNIELDKLLTLFQERESVVRRLVP